MTLHIGYVLHGAEQLLASLVHWFSSIHSFHHMDSPSFPSPCCRKEEVKTILSDSPTSLPVDVWITSPGATATVKAPLSTIIIPSELFLKATADLLPLRSPKETQEIFNPRQDAHLPSEHSRKKKLMQPLLTCSVDLPPHESQRRKLINIQAAHCVSVCVIGIKSPQTSSMFLLSLQTTMARILWLVRGDYT